MFNELLEKLGLTFDDLKPVERETLYSWQEAMSKNELTLEKVKIYINAMKSSVEQELTDTKHNTKEDLFLKARLRNYLLLEALLTSPEKAKEAIERQLAGIIPRK
jgi:hypothetical protein